MDEVKHDPKTGQFAAGAKANAASGKAEAASKEPTKSGSGTEFASQHVRRMAEHKTAKGAHGFAASKAPTKELAEHHEKQSQHHTNEYNKLSSHPNTSSALRQVAEIKRSRR
jgi:hypothetical protein